MDLNHIELPAAAIADLYHSSLVGDIDAPVEKTAAEPVTKGIPAAADIVDEATWRSLGNNQKHILIIVKNDEAVHVPDNELGFLTGILGACKLSLADVAIVNIKEQPASYKELTAYFKSRIVLLFAVEPAAFGLPMSFPHYQIQAFAGNSFLYSPSLKDLENDRVEKSKLWVCLKRLFNL
ncbi:MAG TPA: hypothetical protein VGO58_15640 [Chitinophagaceae bacterium]|jgi:hypothetical protein|nr:hypothetical protein [Chitinophagaceae bacterium]